MAPQHRHHFGIVKCVTALIRTTVSAEFGVVKELISTFTVQAREGWVLDGRCDLHTPRNDQVHSHGISFVYAKWKQLQSG